MKSNFFLYFAGSLMSVLIASESSSAYDIFYMQEPCEENRVITPGQGGWRRYGFIRSDSNGCVDSDKTCSIHMNVSSGYHITLRIQYVSIDCDFGLFQITGETGQPTPFCGYYTPVGSLYSSSNWLRYTLSTVHVPYCQSGVTFYYTVYHTGDCSPDEFRCAYDGRCIPAELKCDWYDNCGDWSDEVSGTCGLSTGAIAAISVTCALVGLCCLAFIVYCLYDRAHRRQRNSTPRRGSTNRCAPETASTVPIGPPTYAESPPDYAYINSVYSGIYEDVDNLKGPPTYQSLSNNNGYPN